MTSVYTSRVAIFWRLLLSLLILLCFNSSGYCLPYKVDVIESEYHYNLKQYLIMNLMRPGLVFHQYSAIPSTNHNGGYRSEITR